MARGATAANRRGGKESESEWRQKKKNFDDRENSDGKKSYWSLCARIIGRRRPITLLWYGHDQTQIREVVLMMKGFSFYCFLFFFAKECWNSLPDSSICLYKSSSVGSLGEEIPSLFCNHQWWCIIMKGTFDRVIMTKNCTDVVWYW